MAILNYDGEKSFVGAVLAEREWNGYHDSDFYALVYDAERDTLRWIEFATTRGGCGAAFGTYVDATEETLDAAERCWERSYLDKFRDADKAAAMTPLPSKTVRLKRKFHSRKLGRSFEAGTTGEVFWRGEDRFHRGAFTAYRIGVKFGDDKVFLAEERVETLGWEELLTAESELAERAKRAAASERAGYARDLGSRYEAGRARNAELEEVAA